MGKTSVVFVAKFLKQIMEYRIVSIWRRECVQKSHELRGQNMSCYDTDEELVEGFTACLSADKSLVLGTGNEFTDIALIL